MTKLRMSQGRFQNQRNQKTMVKAQADLNVYIMRFGAGVVNMDFSQEPVSCVEKAQCRGWIRVTAEGKENHFLVALTLKIDFSTRAEYWYIRDRKVDLEQALRLYGELVVNELRHAALS
jgi:hypothetical protein